MHLPTHIAVDVSVGDQLVDFRCARCGHQALASVSAGGTGLSVNRVSLSNPELDARVGAAQAARLAACPRCGRRDAWALAKVLLVGAVIGTVAALAAGLAAAEQLRGATSDGHVGTHVAIATFLVVVWTTATLKLRSVRRRVRFARP